MSFQIGFRRLSGHLCPIALLVAGSFACSTSLPPDAPEPEVHVLYNPATGKVPLPNDVLRDAEAERLAFPITAGSSPAETEFREFMNTHDAWPTTTPLSAELSAPVDPSSVTSDTVLVYAVESTLRHVTEVSPRLESGDTKIAISPPKSGWTRGATYFVTVRGGPQGVRTKEGRGVGPDQIFFMLRSRTRLDTYANNRAFPGATRDERIALGKRLEDIRVALGPFFDAVEQEPISVPRDDVAALWSFTITKASELAMDPAASRLPMPFDAVIDPQTKLVTLPASPSDTPTVTAMKQRLNRMNGFSVAPTLDFELSTGVDPKTATADNVKVYEIASGRELEIAGVRVLPSEGSAPCRGATLTDVCTHVNVTLADAELPLRPATAYAVVVKSGLKGRDGAAVRPMLTAHFVRAEHPVLADGKSLVSVLTPELAARIEPLRAKTAPLLAKIGRADVVGAWSFTTLDPEPRLQEVAKLADVAELPAKPTVKRRMAIEPGLLGSASSSELEALDLLFADLDDLAKRRTYVPRLRGVGEIVEGTIASPSTIDATTRRARADGSWAREQIPFLLTVPADVPKGEKVPVVIFAHGMLTDRRFLLTIAGALAERGFAAIAIDLPFHGEQTRCSKIPMLIPNFYPDSVRLRDLTLGNDLLYYPACAEGSECTAEGRCVTKDGVTTAFTRIPFSDVPVASGTTMFEFDPPAFVDRVEQAVLDLVSVRRSLRLADWSKVTSGVALESDRVLFAGQSFGAMVGASFVAVTKDVERAVFNSPQADLLAMYRESTLFGPITRAVLDYLKLEDGSYERERILGVARWIFDGIDPESLASALAKRSAFIQMNKADLVVPNPGTERLQRATRLPMKTYPGVLHGALIVPGTGDAMLTDLVESLAGGQVN